MCVHRSPPRRAPRLRRILGAGLAAALLACSGSDPKVDKTDAFAFPPSQAPHGVSSGDWGARWWQWALNVPAATNPLFDETGASCAEGQAGEVWFLAGNFGGTVVRDCTVPAGKDVFVPVLNSFQCIEADNPYYDTADKILAAFDGMFRNVNASVQVDGVAAKDPLSYRARSAAFTLTLAAGNILDAPPGDYPGCFSDGYWVMLRPLSSGQHTIHFTGSMVIPQPMSLDVTYHLTVP